MADSTEIYPTGPEPSRNGGDGYWRSTPRALMIAVGAFAGAVIVVLVALALIGGDDGSVDTADSSTTASVSTPTSADTSSSTSEPDTSASASSATTEPPTSASATTTQPTTSTTESPETYRSAVWPWLDSSTRYTDPVAAARGFAEDYVGFTDPVVGEFMQGDSRSGEVEIRPTADGPATVVFVRQLGSDDTWWVLGSGTANITIDQPTALSTVESPLTVTGAALAFEGHVNVILRADGSLQPLVEDFVTGGGDVARPFEGTFEWTDPGEGAGALTLLTASAEDGRVWEAAVIRVVFASA